MPYKCFVATETDNCWQWLRRYSRTNEHCSASPGRTYHNAMREIERGTVIRNAERYIVGSSHGKTPHDDPRWPTQCECGYQFVTTDEWQVFEAVIYNSERGEVTIHGTNGKPCPPGLMYEAWWMSGVPYGGPDGKIWGVILPNQLEWIIDGPASGMRDKPAWTRTGIVPMISVTPSILANDYHGFLTNGELTDDLSSHKFDEKGRLI